MLLSLGPGVVTGASDDDPSGIATYAQAGARFGFGFLWSALITLPLMASIQEICDRVSLATGKGLGDVLHARFTGRWRQLMIALVACLIGANMLTVSADLVAVGSGLHLLGAGPAWLWALVAGGALTALLVAKSFETLAGVLRALTLVLLSYLIVVVVAHPPWSRVLASTLIPHVEISKEYMRLLIAVLGTTISPYLLFWQSEHRIEERRTENTSHRARPLKSRSDASSVRERVTSRVDVILGMTFSNVVMWAIILTSATTFAAHGRHQIDSAAQAAQALRPLAGRYASVLFAIGFVGSGLLVVPVLAGSAAAAMAGLVKRSWGFSKSVRSATFFYALVGAGTIGGTLLTLVHLSPMRLLVLAAVVNGLVAPPFLALVMIVSRDEKLMGKMRNGPAASILGWSTTLLMTLAALGLLI